MTGEKRFSRNKRRYRRKGSVGERKERKKIYRCPKENTKRKSKFDFF